jgi:tetratricopeptide (TPR) repeat protein
MTIIRTAITLGFALALAGGLSGTIRVWAQDGAGPAMPTWSQEGGAERPSAADLEGMAPDRAQQIRDLLAAVDTDPENPDLWSRLGDALALRPARPEAAISAYTAALLYDPDRLETERRLASLLVSQGLYRAALNTYESILPRMAEDPEWIDLATACTLYARLEDLDRGAALLDHMLMIAPHDRTVLALGVVERARGDEAGGRALMEAVRDSETAAPLLRELASHLLDQPAGPEAQP